MPRLVANHVGEDAVGQPACENPRQDKGHHLAADAVHDRHQQGGIGHDQDHVVIEQARRHQRHQPHAEHQALIAAELAPMRNRHAGQDHDAHEAERQFDVKMRRPGHMENEIGQLEPAHADLARHGHRMQRLLPRPAVMTVSQDHQIGDTDTQHGPPQEGKGVLPQRPFVEQEDDEIGDKGWLDAGAGQHHGRERPSCLREEKQAGQHHGVHDDADIGADKRHRGQSGKGQQAVANINVGETLDQGKPQQEQRRRRQQHPDEQPTCTGHPERTDKWNEQTRDLRRVDIGRRAHTGAHRRMDGIGRMVGRQRLGAAQHSVDIHQHPGVVREHVVEPGHDWIETEKRQHADQRLETGQSPHDGQCVPRYAHEYALRSPAPWP